MSLEYLSEFKLEGFRNLQPLALACSSELNIITGPNGSGKTSLIEALYFLSHGRSFRVQQIKTMIQNDKSHFAMHAKMKRDDHQTSIGMIRSLSGQSDNHIQGSKGVSAAQISKNIPTLCLTPENLSIRGAKNRIKTLDWLVFYTQPTFHQQWLQLSRLIKQRNMALKTVASDAVIAALDQTWVPMACQIDHLRQQVFSKLTPHLKESLARFLPGFDFSYQYLRGWKSGDDLNTLLAASMRQDRKYGVTHCSPMKADWVYRIGGQRAQDVLSRGQYKLLVCAQAIAMAEALKQEEDQRALILMDDVLAELDVNNSEKLMDYWVKSKFQVFITGLSKEILVKYKNDNSQLFKLKSGVLGS